MAAMEKKHVSLEKQVYDLQQQIARMNNQGQETDVSENSNNKVWTDFLCRNRSL